MNRTFKNYFISILLKEKKVLDCILQRMRNPVHYDENNWYYRWLVVSWFIWPVITWTFTLLVGVINDTDLQTSTLLHNLSARNRLYGILGMLDFVFLAYLVSEFYTVSFFF